MLLVVLLYLLLGLPFLIYQESDVIIRAIRDYLRSDVEEIWIDDPEVHKRCHEFMSQVMPHNLNKLQLYKENDPLFTRWRCKHYNRTTDTYQEHNPPFVNAEIEGIIEASST